MKKKKKEKAYIILIYDEFDDESHIYKKATFCSSAKKVFKYLKKKDYIFNKHDDLDTTPVYKHKSGNKCVIVSKCDVYNGEQE